MKPSFTYAARVERVVDADTLDVAIDLGFRIEFRVRLRVAHIDASEMSTDAGKRAKAYVLDRLCETPDHDVHTHHATGCTFVPVVLATRKPDKFGRSLADVAYGDEGRDLAVELVSAGHAQPYEGGRRG